jgi:hypothetical protein
MNSLMHKYMKYALLILFVGYLGGLFSFTHVHIVNGVTIVHSHPFSDDNHQHCGSELQLLHKLSTIQHVGSFAQSNVTIKPYYAFVLSVSIPEAIDINKPFLAEAAQLRAPPTSLT